MSFKGEYNELYPSKMFTHLNNDINYKREITANSKAS